MVRGPVVATGASPKSRSTSEDASTLGRSARVRGRISGEGDLRVEGQVEGDVTISGELVIEDGASVTGDVSAGTVVVAGALQGDVAAGGPVAVRATAQVAGNLAGSEVSLEEGASFHGRIEAEFDLPVELGETPKPPPQAPHAGRGRNR